MANRIKHLTGEETDHHLVSRQTLVRGTVSAVSGSFSPTDDTPAENPLENATGRYNYLPKKFSLDNFLERNVSDAPVASYLRVAGISDGNQATAITVVSIVVASLITVGAVFAIKRKKKAV